MVSRTWQQRSAPRRTLIASACCAAIGLLAALWTRRLADPVLIDPPTCGGLVDNAASALASAFPSMQLARTIGSLDDMALAVAVLVLGLALVRPAGSLLAAWLLSVSIGFHPAFGPRLGSWPGLWALAMALIVFGLARSRSTSLAAGAAIALALAPPLMPVLLGVLVVAHFVLRGMATTRASAFLPLIAARASVFAVVVLTVWLVPHQSAPEGGSALACLVPRVSVDDLALGLGQAFTGNGPLLFGLALLGVSAAGRPGVDALALFTTAALVVSSDARMLEADGGAAFAIALCLAAGYGVNAARAMTATSRSGTLAMAGLILLVPALAGQAWLLRLRTPASPTWGHARLTLAELERRIAALPRDARVVADDALSGLLLDAATLGDRVTVRPGLASRLVTPIGLDGAYAMPRSQARLSVLGFRLTRVADAPGLARLTLGGACRGVGEAWRAFPELAAADAVTLVARARDEVGPAIAYFAFTEPPAVRPLVWLTAGFRGLYWSTYSLDDAAESAALRQELGADRVDVDFPTAPATYVTRLELWRIPDAPPTLTASLGAHPTAAIASMKPEAVPPRIGLCPAFPDAVSPFAPLDGSPE